MSIDTMKAILARHKENRKYYVGINSYWGIRHCDQMIFDWKVRIYTVQSFMWV